jgi:hypothetical protein
VRLLHRLLIIDADVLGYMLDVVQNPIYLAAAPPIRYRLQEIRV